MRYIRFLLFQFKHLHSMSMLVDKDNGHIQCAKCGKDGRF